MNSIKRFNAQRFFLLIRNEILLNRGNFLIFFAVIWGILLLRLIITVGPPNNIKIYGGNYSFFIFFSAYIIFEKAFKEVHDESKGTAWFTLPASMFEKYVSRLVFSIVASTAGIAILFFLFTAISEGVYRFLFGSVNAVALFNPFNKDILLKTVLCLILVSPFHLGVIYFRKNAFFKTFLSLLIYLLFLCLVFIAALKIYLGDVIHGFLTMSDPVGTIPDLFIENDTLAQTWSITKWTAHITFWYLLAPLCWVIGYIRLKEKEV